MTQYNQELGALRSEITLTLHSSYATRLWNGRPLIRESGKVVQAQILSMPSCLSILSQIQKDAANDDPFADYYLLEFEQMVLTNIQEMSSIIERYLELYANLVPEGIDVSRCENIAPVQYPIYVNSQLGYKLIHLLSSFDTLARSVMTGAHIALFTRGQASEWVNEGAKLIRRCFAIVERYRHSGVTRQDAAANNVRYQEAVNRLKIQLPADVLSGERRAMFAPVIRNSSQETDTDEIGGGEEIAPVLTMEGME